LAVVSKYGTKQELEEEISKVEVGDEA